ncbi:hypothetical protein PBAL39_19459 [Pedobacter sp. BAL39]|uniref:hypothetical protein n=1 Tax=Pedobacter sp. BAL39 TaxID=391596 RepID=UPI000155AD7D|nr:hypothetical protein [Pedobacter sp. BAL39]EDM34155.1 hypothetical protein PBAL39_19459 [Pedobacter sp. BAL39]
MHYCFGYCKDCQTVHSLPSAQAIPYCYELMEQLRQHQRIDFDLPEALANPLLSTDVLYSEMRGRMFGILVCEDRQGKEVVLRAFSSRHNGVWNVDNWVPPLVDEHRFKATVSAGDVDIHPLTDLISGLRKGSKEWLEKVAERRIVSQGVLARLYALYTLHNFKGEQRSLQGAFNTSKGIPVGTGDCCAPKLLNYAAIHQLKPLSLAEFFWGKETASGHRREGDFQVACSEKCQPILGYMLCGAGV